MSIEEIVSPGYEAADIDDSSLSVLYQSILAEFEAAIENSHGWIWQNVNVATHIHEASSRLQHWTGSIDWMASHSRGADTKTSMVSSPMLLEQMETRTPLMANVIRSYLKEIRGIFACIMNSHGTDQDRRHIE